MGLSSIYVLLITYEQQTIPGYRGAENTIIKGLGQRTVAPATEVTA